MEYASARVGAEAIVIYPYAHLSSRLERPARAHRVLVGLERLVASRWKGRLHRAPFGWYKRFTIRVKGHPLAELSRTFTPGDPVYRPGEGRVEPVDPERLPDPAPSLRGLAGEKARLFGLDPWRPGWVASGAYERLEAWLHSRSSGPLQGRLQAPPPSRSVEALRLYRLAAQLEPGWSLDPGAPWRIAVLDAGQARLADLLDELSEGLSGGLGEERLCGSPPCLDLGVDGVLYYVEAGGSRVPVAVEHAGKLLVGPLHSLATAIVAHEAERAEREDYTPMLPPWMHPATIYIIPVQGAGEYARHVALQAAGIGAGAVVDESTRSLGARIRRAGQLWAPIVATVGPREEATGTVTVRRRWAPGSQETLSLPGLLDEIRGLLYPARVPGLVRVLREA